MRTATVPDPFHEGEQEAQRRAGQAALAERTGSMIADRINDGARRFLEQQAWLVAARAGGDGAPWASILFGEVGFVNAPDQAQVVIDLQRVARTAGDPFWTGLRAETDLGLLAIDLATRRRLRINVRVVEVGASLRGVVREAYPNCPKYITPRQLCEGGAPARDLACHHGETLDASRTALVRRADTALVASYHPARGADASHRGGPPGFVEVIDEATLRIPDYPGNGMYNTLGNLLVAPSAGLTFVDFAERRVLQITGRARVVFGVADAGGPADTGRFWELSIHRWMDAPMPEGWKTEPPR